MEDCFIVLRVCSVLFDYRVETEISICLETQKLLSQGPLIGQHSRRLLYTYFPELQNGISL